MATTTNYSFEKPTVGGNEDTWGTLLNGNWDALDALLGGVSATEFAILDGATVTTAELNYVDGVTSAIQTQIDGKQDLDATLTALASLSTGANKIPMADGTDSFTQIDFKDEDNMASDSATAVPSQQSVKAYVDAGSITQTSGSAPYYGCRAWVNFSGSGTVSIRASGNVSSITDNATGNYTINFTTAMPDANYSIVATGNDPNADTTFRGVNLGQTGNITASSCQIFAKAVNSAAQVFEDLPVICVAIFR